MNTDASVHMCKIGSGRARGDWFIISRIIHEILVEYGVKVVVHSLDDCTPTQLQSPILFMDHSDVEPPAFFFTYLKKLREEGDRIYYDALTRDPECAKKLYTARKTKLVDCIKMEN